MKLFTRAQREKLLANGTRRGADHKPVVRFFNPTGAGTWLLTELDPDHPDDYGFGLADLGMGFPELGDIGVREISEFRGLMGLGIERDMYFRPKYAISVYAEAARAAGRTRTPKCASEPSHMVYSFIRGLAAVIAFTPSRG